MSSIVVWWALRKLVRAKRLIIAITIDAVIAWKRASSFLLGFIKRFSCCSDTVDIPPVGDSIIAWSNKLCRIREKIEANHVAIDLDPLSSAFCQSQVALTPSPLVWAPKFTTRWSSIYSKTYSKSCWSNSGEISGASYRAVNSIDPLILY